MSRRSSPSFAVGGVSWLDQDGNPGDANRTPLGGWTCYHCGDNFQHWRAARRHFGNPGTKAVAACVIVPS